MMRAAFLALVTGAALAALASGVGAGDAPAAGGLAGGSVAQGDLAGFLTEAGFAPVPDGQFLRVSVKHEDKEYPLHVRLSPDGRYLWLSAPLARLPERRPLPAEFLVGMLASNSGDGGYQFLLVGDLLVLARVVDNRALRPDIVRRELSGLLDAAREGSPLWNTEAWFPPEAGSGGGGK